jgi:hypothetical protein
VFVSFCLSIDVVLRGWLARRKYARLREVHQLQLTFIRKFSEDIALTGQSYRTHMDHQCHYDAKRQYKHTHSNRFDEDDEQIEKTLNFFDAMLDPYLNDNELNEEHRSTYDLSFRTAKISS